MTDVRVLAEALGEVVHVQTLRRYGVGAAALRAALRSGAIERLRPGWFATALADRDQRRAVLAHGRIGCASALARYGIWSGEGTDLHVQVPGNAARLIREPTVDGLGGPPVWHPSTPDRLRRRIHLADPRAAPLVHWRTDTDQHRALDWIVSPVDALAAAVRCLDPDHAQAAVDSAVAERVIPRRQVERVVAAAPARAGVRVDEYSARLESGAESIFVRRLQRAGFEVHPQFAVPGGHGRFDGVIEGCILFEVDGWAHHGSYEAFMRDRDRTLVAQSLGMPVIRVAANQVLRDWPTVIAAVARTVTDARPLRAAVARPAAG